tara:strand:+ start:1439 stop:3538 length:2100 start_codon:yes stop_codon:yes gene_type:complete
LNLEKISTQREQTVERLMELNDRNLDHALESLEDAVVQKVRDTIIRKITEGNVVDARAAIEMRRELKQTIDEHYVAWARQTTKGYDKAAGAILKSFGQLPLPADIASLTDVDRDVISGLQKMTFSGYEEIGATFLEDISKNVYQNALAGRSFEDYERELRQKINGVYIRSDDSEIEKLVNIAQNGTPSQAKSAINRLHIVYARDKVGGNLRKYAKAYAHDSLMEFDAAFNAHKAEAAGLSHYKYYGSLMADSRPICRAMVGKVFTKEEMRSRWSTFSNRAGMKPGDPLIVKGGYNCRHHWQAVKPEWVEEASSLETKKAEQALQAVKGRGVKGDDLLNVQDLMTELEGVGAQINLDGTVRVYHRTSPENAAKIRESGEMFAKEPDIFFSTSVDSEYGKGFGDSVVAVDIPIEDLQLDDIFPGKDASVSIGGHKLPIGKAVKVNVSGEKVGGTQIGGGFANSSLEKMWRDASTPRLQRILKTYEDDLYKAGSREGAYDPRDWDKWVEHKKFIEDELANRGAKLKPKAARKVVPVTPDQKLTDVAFKYFGETGMASDTGYIMADGRQLDLSGANQGGTPGIRSLDHRDVTGLEGMKTPGDEPTKSMFEFQNRTGAIRTHVSNKYVYVSLTTKPTDEAFDKLMLLVEARGGGLVLDVDNGETLGTIASREWDKVKPSEVRRFIDEALGRKSLKSRYFLGKIR